MLAFKSDDPISNPDYDYSFFCTLIEKNENKQKEAHLDNNTDVIINELVNAGNNRPL